MVDNGREAGKHNLSVIIPTINEAGHLPVLLDQLQQQKNIRLEIIVVDGGSTDNTRAIAKAKGVKLISSNKGRALQLNAGAKQASFSTLLFLHADSELRDGDLLAKASEAFATVESENNKVAGHFPLKFIRGSKKHRLAFQFLEEKTLTNRPYTINGDQGLLITKEFFDKLGGYDGTLPVMEDQAIAAKIFAQGRWLLLPGQLHTSARRFETEGFHRRYILMGIMMALFWTDAHSFFARAKNVYADHDKTKRLKLWPYFRCIWAMLIQDYGFRQSFAQWYNVGRFVRQNAWQPFFFFDVCLRTIFRANSHLFMGIHNIIFYPLTNNKLGDVIVAPLIFVWYMLILGPLFYLLDLRTT